MPEDNPILSPPSESDPILSPPVEPNPPLPEEPTPPVPSEKPILEEKSTPIIAETKDISADKLSAIQKAGMKLAIGVGSVITLVIIAILIQASILIFQSKTDSVEALQINVAEVLKQNAPGLNSTNNEERQNAQNAIKLAQDKVNQATLNDSTWTRITTLFDLIVSKSLLPIFTTILGYIFGSRAARDDSQ